MKIEENGASRSGIQVISRAASILRLLKENQDGMSLGQIASQVNLARSTVQRIVGALQAERFLISNAGGNGVRLGPELGALAEAARYNTVEECRNLLVDLTKATGETSDLSVLRGETMIFVDQIPGTHRLRTVSSIGEVFPITSTANGRACLAILPKDVALRHAQKEVRDLDQDAFSAMLDGVRTAGLAYDNDEHSEGISAIGFAFKDWFGEIYAISVPVPTTRFLRQKSEIEKAVLRTKMATEAMMNRAPLTSPT